MPHEDFFKRLAESEEVLDELLLERAHEGSWFSVAIWACSVVGLFFILAGVIA